MKRNDGKKSEDEFKKLAKAKGWYLLRLVDPSEVYARNFGVKVSLDPQPCDFIIVDKQGGTYFVEIKSMATEGTFNFSRLSKYQHVAAKRITSLGGNYVIYLHVKETKKWYRIPYIKFLKSEKKSLNTEELNNYVLS